MKYEGSFYVYLSYCRELERIRRENMYLKWHTFWHLAVYEWWNFPFVLVLIM